MIADFDQAQTIAPVQAPPATRRRKPAPSRSLLWGAVVQSARTRPMAGWEGAIHAFSSLLILIGGCGAWALGGRWSIEGAQRLLAWAGVAVGPSVLWWLLPISISAIQFALKRDIRSVAVIILIAVNVFDATTTAYPLVSAMNDLVGPSWGVRVAAIIGVLLAVAAEFMLQLGAVYLVLYGRKRWVAWKNS